VRRPGALAAAGLFAAAVAGGAALAAPSAPAATAAVAVKGACTSRAAAGCERCEITLGHQVELRPAGAALTASCPSMASGRYELDVKVPVKLVPPDNSASSAGAPAGGAPGAAGGTKQPTFFQVFASFGAQGRDERGRANAVLPETPQASWSWWNPSGMTVDRTEVVEIPQRAAIDVTFTLSDPQYYLPAEAERAAHRDGRLFIDRGAVMRLTRVPAQAAAQPAEVRDFSNATLARVVPGRATKAQVRALLGKPWRDMHHGDEENPANDVWDYRGQDASGSYLVHIEFDPHDIRDARRQDPAQGGIRCGNGCEGPAARSRQALAADLHRQHRHRAAIHALHTGSPRRLRAEHVQQWQVVLRDWYGERGHPMKRSQRLALCCCSPCTNAAVGGRLNRGQDPPVGRRGIAAISIRRAGADEQGRDYRVRPDLAGAGSYPGSDSVPDRPVVQQTGSQGGCTSRAS